MRVKIIKVPPKELFNYQFKLNGEPGVSQYLGEQLIDNGFAEYISHTLVGEFDSLKDFEEEE